MSKNDLNLYELTSNEKESISGGSFADEIGYAIGYAVGWIEFQVDHASASPLGARTEALLHSS